MKRSEIIKELKDRGYWNTNKSDKTFQLWALLCILRDKDERNKK